MTALYSHTATKMRRTSNSSVCHLNSVKSSFVALLLFISAQMSNVTSKASGRLFNNVNFKQNNWVILWGFAMKVQFFLVLWFSTIKKRHVLHGLHSKNFVLLCLQCKILPRTKNCWFEKQVILCQFCEKWDLQKSEMPFKAILYHSLGSLLWIQSLQAQENVLM